MLHKPHPGIDGLVNFEGESVSDSQTRFMKQLAIILHTVLKKG